MPVMAHLSLERLRCAAPYYACLIRTTELQIGNEELETLRTLLGSLTAFASATWHLQFEVFAQLAQFGGGKEALRKYREMWRPALGLGVWPDRPSPTLWTREDLIDLGPNEKPRPLMYQLLRVTAPSPARHEARNTLFELGSMMQIMLPDPALFFRNSKHVLLAKVTEPILRAYPFYVPLLDTTSIGACENAHDLKQLLCGASVYLRHSSEDGGLLLISEHPLDTFWDQLGFTL